MKKKVDLIIFDFDGTLVNSQADIINSVNKMLLALGLPGKRPEEIAGFIGTGLKQLIIDVLGEASASKLKEAVKLYKDIYRKHMFDNTAMYPGVMEALEYFKDKKKIVISNKSKEFIELSLKKFKIEKFFIKVSGGDDDNCRKPSACPIIKVMKEFKVKQSETIIVGDSFLDIQTGINAGIFTCGVTCGIGKKEDILALKPDFVIDRISKLKDILQ